MSAAKACMVLGVLAVIVFSTIMGAVVAEKLKFNKTQIYQKPSSHSTILDNIESRGDLIAAYQISEKTYEIYVVQKTTISGRFT